MTGNEGCSERCFDIGGSKTEIKTSIPGTTGILALLFLLFLQLGETAVGESERKKKKFQSKRGSKFLCELLQRRLKEKKK